MKPEMHKKLSKLSDSWRELLLCLQASNKFLKLIPRWVYFGRKRFLRGPQVLGALGEGRDLEVNLDF